MITDLEPTPEITLTPGQERALEVFKSGSNMLLTGPAGTGKSFVLSSMLEIDPKIAITATTGIAASALNGRTINSWAGLGLMEGPIDTIIASISKAAERRIKDVKTLVIDEVSMASGEMISILDRAFKETRGNDDPFGGVQMIFVGDFHQLPPVKADKLAFESRAWSDGEIEVVVLTEVVRQSDAVFKDILSAIRTGNVNGVDFGPLLDRMLPVTDNDIPILESKNVDVEAMNLGRLAQLEGEESLFNAKDFGPEYFLKTCPFPLVLALKPGARVMSRVNLSNEIYNGKMGTIITVEDDFEPPTLVIHFDGMENPVRVKKQTSLVTEGTEWVEVVETEQDPDVMSDKYGRFFRKRACKHDGGTWKVHAAKVVAGRNQFPLTLGWAITIHKSQGATLDKAFVKLKGTFSAGQTYVALSRVRSLEGLFIDSIPRANVSKKVKEFYQN